MIVTLETTPLNPHNRCLHINPPSSFCSPYYMIPALRLRQAFALQHQHVAKVLSPMSDFQWEGEARHAEFIRAAQLLSLVLILLIPLPLCSLLVYNAGQ